VSKAQLPQAGANAALLHELEVHQIELEMQNEELRHAQADLARARDRFSDLYDFAPVGYLTLDDKGVIASANLTGAVMLGEDRAALLGRRLANFIAPSHLGPWPRLLRKALQQEDPQRMELVLRRRDGTSFHAQLDGLRFVPPGEPPALRITLTDITQRKQAEIDRRIADTAVDAREAERRHVARELHEGLGQRLTALKMQLSSLTAEGGQDARKKDIAAMLESLDEAVATVRRIAIELRPLMLDDLGLNAAIEWLAHDTARRLGLDITLELEDIDPPLDERTAIACYRMLQDMLSHVAHHTQAPDVRVTMGQRDNVLRLTVQGLGSRRIQPADEAADARMTMALRDRAHVLGGHVDVGGSPGDGTRIVIQLPLLRPAGFAPGWPTHFKEHP
jgi:PAS domain S-box-containing protein